MSAAGCHDAPTAVAGSSKRRLIALVGPPNCGKSTLFNHLTGMRQKVANYPGVTVEKRTGVARMPGGSEVELVDLPGVYSMAPQSEDERISHDVLLGKADGLRRPDGVVIILDSTNLGRGPQAGRRGMQRSDAAGTDSQQLPVRRRRPAGAAVGFALPDSRHTWD